MTKPHEETWTLTEDEGGPVIDMGAFHHGEGSERRSLGVSAIDWASMRGSASEAQMRLAAAAPAMARLLLRVRRVDTSDGEFYPRCVICQKDQTGAKHEHTKDCELVAVLRAAGVLPP